METSAKFSLAVTINSCVTARSMLQINSSDKMSIEIGVTTRASQQNEQNVTRTISFQCRHYLYAQVYISRIHDRIDKLFINV